MIRLEHDQAMIYQSKVFENLGIFSLLEEECVVPNGQESRFLDKMLDKHKTHPSLIRVKHSQKSTVIKHFAVSHYAGQVDYNVDRWLEKNKVREGTSIGMMHLDRIR